MSRDISGKTIDVLLAKLGNDDPFRALSPGPFIPITLDFKPGTPAV